MRRAPRYDASIPCTLEAEEGGLALEGVIADLSIGGAGIDAAGAVPARFTLVFEFEGETLRLPCETRHSRALWSRHRIHAQFDALNPMEEDSLGRVLASLQEAGAAMAGRTRSLTGLARRAFRR